MVKQLWEGIKMNDAKKLINFRELNKILGLKNAIYSNRIPEKHKASINELFDIVGNWIEKHKTKERY